jgi:type III secretory pathway component EscR
MRSFLVALTAVSLVVSAYSTAPAADDKKLTSQQEKMKSCNGQAADKKGDERKAFMSSCLKAGAPAAPMTQQDKMKKCNADASAKSLKGDERKGFMSECLKGDKKS